MGKSVKSCDGWCGTEWRSHANDEHTEYRPFTDDNANIVIIGDKASTQHPEAMVETMKEAVAMDIRLIPFIDWLYCETSTFPGCREYSPSRIVAFDSGVGLLWCFHPLLSFDALKWMSKEIDFGGRYFIAWNHHCILTFPQRLQQRTLINRSKTVWWSRV